MGEDGHCLSLFPGRPEVEVGDRLVVPVHDSPKPPPDRVSLTLAALAGTERLLVLAAGPARPARRQGPGRRRPPPGDQGRPAVRSAGGSVTWLLDRAAAAAS